MQKNQIQLLQSLYFSIKWYVFSSAKRMYKVTPKKLDMQMNSGNQYSMTSIKKLILGNFSHNFDLKGNTKQTKMKKNILYGMYHSIRLWKAISKTPITPEKREISQVSPGDQWTEVWTEVSADLSSNLHKPETRAV